MQKYIRFDNFTLNIYLVVRQFIWRVLQLATLTNRNHQQYLCQKVHDHLSDESDQDYRTTATYLYIIIFLLIPNKFIALLLTAMLGSHR